MADTLEQIFNVTLDDTDLASGEATVLTTNSTTRFVVKDIAVDNGSAVTNASLELNGFDVADLTGANSGSLIVPPDSTLKIKSSDYPITFEDINVVYGPQANQNDIVNDVQPLIGGIPQSVVSTSQTRGGGASYQAHWLTETHMYYQNWDGNSTNQIRYALRSDPNTTLTVTNDSYGGNAVFDGRYLIWQHASQVNRWDTTTNTASHIGLSTNKTISSYPRNAYVNGTRYVFHASSSGDQRFVNIDTGSTIEISTGSRPNQDQNTYKLFAVYNSTDDILYYGGFSGSNPDLVLMKIPTASTYLNNTTGTQNISAQAIMSGYNASSSGMSNHYLGQYTLFGKHDSDGTWLYWNKNGSNDTAVYRWNLDKATLNNISSVVDTEEEVIALSQTPYAFDDSTINVYADVTTAAEQTARNYDLSTYNIKAHATGVKVV